MREVSTLSAPHRLVDGYLRQRQVPPPQTAICRVADGANGCVAKAPVRVVPVTLGARTQVCTLHDHATARMLSRRPTSSEDWPVIDPQERARGTSISKAPFERPLSQAPQARACRAARLLRPVARAEAVAPPSSLPPLAAGASGPDEGCEICEGGGEPDGMSLRGDAGWDVLTCKRHLGPVCDLT